MDNSLIFLGKFNPAIFSPAWIRSHDIIQADDGSDPILQIIHPRLADFTVSEIRFFVEPSRLQVQSSVHDMDIVVGAANRILDEHLSHTPLQAFGINFSTHEDVGTFARMNAIGRVLAPLDPWGDWATDFDNEDPLLNGGINSLSMKKIFSSPPCDEYTIITVEPSQKDELKGHGVMVAGNNHFGYSPDEAKKYAEENSQSELNKILIEKLNKSHFECASQFAETVETIVSLA